MNEGPLRPFLLLLLALSMWYQLSANAGSGNALQAPRSETQMRAAWLMNNMSVDV
jgi:hypothetical protein